MSTAEELTQFCKTLQNRSPRPMQPITTRWMKEMIYVQLANQFPYFNNINGNTRQSKPYDCLMIKTCTNCNCFTGFKHQILMMQLDYNLAFCRNYFCKKSSIMSPWNSFISKTSITTIQIQQKSSATIRQICFQ